MWLWSQVVCPQLLQELHICLSASFGFQTTYLTSSPSLRLGSTLHSSLHFPPGFGALPADINHGGPSGLEANCEETGLNAVALATMLQTCLDPRPFKRAGGQILGQGLHAQS